jgi:hypothetical protein
LLIAYSANPGKTLRGAQVLDRAHGEGAGVVHHDVQSPEHLRGVIHRRSDLVEVLTVGLDRHRATSGVLDGAGHRGRLIRPLPVGHSDIGSLLSQTTRDRRPDSTTSTRDQRDLVC